MTVDPARRPPRDQPADLRRQLRRLRAGGRAALARAALGRQLHDALLLAGRHRQPRERLVLLQHRVAARSRHAPRRLDGRSLHRRDARRGRRDAPDRAADRLDAEGPRAPLGLLGRRSTAPQQSTECTVTGYPPWCQPDAGNGITPTARRSPATTRTTPRARSAPTSSPAGWQHIAGRVGTAAAGGVRFFALDNEPTSGTRRTATCTPRPLSYDEIWQRTVDYASAIKAQDPAAQVLGPVALGLVRVLLVGARRLRRRRPGSRGARRRPLPRVVPAAGPRLRGRPRRAPRRLPRHPLLPAGRHVALSDDESASAALRLRSLKCLYDPDYVDESWIGSLLRRRRGPHPADEGVDRRALPRHEARDHRVQLGRGRRHQLRARAGRGARDLRPRGRRPRHALGRAGCGHRVEDAFRLYLDYDGAGSAVSGRQRAGDERATWTTLGAYAVAGNGTRLFLLLFNKATGDRDASVSFPAALHWRARLWRFDAANAARARRDDPCPRAAPSPCPCRPARPRWRSTLLDFDDVPVTHPFYDFVMTVEDDGVSAGCGRGDFCPDASVTRAQMAVFLLKAKLGEHYAPPACDRHGLRRRASRTDFAAAWIEDLAARGITGGCGGGRLLPGRRGHAAADGGLPAEGGARLRLRAARRRRESSTTCPPGDPFAPLDRGALRARRSPAAARHRRCSTARVTPTPAGRWRSF